MNIYPKPPCFDGFIPENIAAGDPMDRGRYQNAKIEQIEIPLEGKFIEDGIGEAYLNWNKRNPVLIDAPTGSGKSTFVCRKLIRHAAQQGRNLLLVSNRVALVRQQRMKVAEVVSEYDSAISKQPDDEEIDTYRIWHNVCICTYHGLQALLNQEAVFLSNVMYAVFDEIHFLYADATYAASCGSLLAMIPAAFARATRVYLTATSWSIKNSILNSEKNLITMREKLFPRLRFDTQYLWFSFMLNGRKFLHYSFRMDYSRYQLHFFPYNAIHPQQSTQKSKEASEQSKIGKSDLTEILPNPSSNNKLLVFVMRIDDGLALEKAWKAKGVDAVFLDRTSKFSPDSMGSSEITEEFSGTNEQKEQKHTVWKKLLRDERFDADVLISTSFLDTGINIHDDAVKTIVCYANDPTSFFQMIGRKRLSPDARETVDIWVGLLNSNWFSRTAREKQFEVELAEKLNFIRSFQTEKWHAQNGQITPCLHKENNQIYEAAYDITHYVTITQHENLLKKRFDWIYGENYHSFFRTFWNSSNRVKDQKLFRFDSIGQVYVDQYIKWVIQEQMRFCTEMGNAGDFRLIVAGWMGKKEFTDAFNRKKTELQKFLDNHCQTPIVLEERSILFSMIDELAPIDMPKLSSKTGSGSQASTVTARLHSIGFHYNIQREPGAKSKHWRVSKEPPETETESTDDTMPEVKESLK